VYGHFLYPSGSLAVQVGLKMKIPSFVAVGDDTIFDHFHMTPRSKSVGHFNEVSGIVAVSNKNKRDCHKALQIAEEKIRVLPNGVDLSLFYPRDRTLMRRKLGLPQDLFLAAFTGHFIERKGPHRVLAAVSGMDGTGLLFVGAGPIQPRGRNVLFRGVLEHAELPEMLSAADVFVLPTLMEGSCNAVLEALACGLPVVTSRGEFNDDIVDDSVAIRVDPLSIREIGQAVDTLRRDPALREAMSQNAVGRIRDFDINIRAERILKWLGEAREPQGGLKVCRPSACSARDMATSMTGSTIRRR
jgi:glycosyltransferase involved in cell wall biosynthesis